MSDKFKFVFFGSSPISVTALECLYKKGMVPVAVVTSPDKRAGRGMDLTPSPVKAWAEKHRNIAIEYWQGDTALLAERLRGYEAMVFVLVSFGKILPKTILDIPRKGVVNLHPSLLPKLRGPSPIESTILNDMRDEAGVSIMLLTEGMDKGPILAQKKVEVASRACGWPPRGDELYKILSDEGGLLLAESLPQWIEDKITPKEQDDTRATYTRKYRKSDGEVDLEADPYQNLLKIRAFYPWPSAYFFVERDGRKIRVKIVDAKVEDGKLHILRVVPEGKGEVSYEDFTRGSH